MNVSQTLQQSFRLNPVSMTKQGIDDFGEFGEFRKQRAGPLFRSAPTLLLLPVGISHVRRLWTRHYRPW